MRRLITYLGIGIIAFTLGLLALGLWTNLHFGELDAPKQMVINGEQYQGLSKLAEDLQCYQLIPPAMYLGDDGKFYCTAEERVRIPNCP